MSKLIDLVAISRGVDKANAIAPGQLETGFIISHVGMNDFGMEIAIGGGNLMTRGVSYLHLRFVVMSI